MTTPRLSAETMIDTYDVHGNRTRANIGALFDYRYWQESELGNLDAHYDARYDARYDQRYAPLGYCGLQWNQSTDAYTRLGSTVGVAIGSKPDDSLIPIQAGMKACVVDDLMRIKYFLDPTDWSKKANGDASVLTGADGQVMVYVPLFYHRYSYASNVHTREISLLPRSGFVPHRWFVEPDGTVVPYRLFPSFEGVLYDTSESRYTNCIYLPAHSCEFVSGDKTITSARTHAFSLLAEGDLITVSGTSNNNGTFTVAAGGTGDATITVEEALTDETAANTVIETPKDFTATTGDKLSSVAGFSPVNYLTRANGRVLATNRGPLWTQQHAASVHAIQLLILMEYGTFRSQSAIGNGLTGWLTATWTAWNDQNPINATGLVTSNATANVSGGGGVVGSYMSYRGIENFFGHLWKWLDGLNVNDNVPYLCFDKSKFADGTASSYLDPGITLPASDGYQSTLFAIADAFLPSAVGASSSTKLADYYYQSSGWRVARFGGGSNDDVLAGAFYLAVSSSVAGRDRFISARLCS